MNSSLMRAIELLKKKIGDKKIIGYWTKGLNYVFCVDIGNLASCSYYLVNGNSVTGTNPILANLDMKSIKKL